MSKLHVITECIIYSVHAYQCNSTNYKQVRASTVKASSKKAESELYSCIYIYTEVAHTESELDV